MTADDDPPSLSRRGLLAGLAAVSSAGCLQRVRSVVNGQSRDPISVTIKTLPADADETAASIARRLQQNMEAIGIDASIELMSEENLFREILLNHDFDLYVGRFPPRTDPDFLRPTLHSKFVTESGWQNPFGVSEIDLDERLEEQRTTAGSARRRAVEDLAMQLAQSQPFHVIFYPEEMKIVRTDRFTGWPDDGFDDPLSYLSLDRLSDAETSSTDSVHLRLASTDARITKNLNPIAVEYRRHGLFTGFLYDSLARRNGGEIKPWLGTNIDWSDKEETTATVTLREDANWHDGESLTPADVVFSYQFYDDTALGQRDMAIPAPRFRGRSSLVESIDTLDSNAIRLSFGETTRAVAERSLTLPILPAHIWESKTDPANVAGVEITSDITEALVWQNAEPVGSGPLVFDDKSAGERLVLSRFEDHFLGSNPPSWFDGAPDFDKLIVQIAPSEGAAVALVTGGDADATASSIGPDADSDIEASGDIETRQKTSKSFYHVGFNARRDPFGNVRFRRLIARLLDSSMLVEELLDGFGQPAATPLAGTGWTPMSLRWSGSDPIVPFFGTDGDLDVSTAKDAFRDAGYRYNDEGELVR